MKNPRLTKNIIRHKSEFDRAVSPHAIVRAAGIVEISAQPAAMIVARTLIASVSYASGAVSTHLSNLRYAGDSFLPTPTNFCRNSNVPDQSMCFTSIPWSFCEPNIMWVQEANVRRVKPNTENIKKLVARVGVELDSLWGFGDVFIWI